MIYPNSVILHCVVGICTGLILIGVIVFIAEPELKHQLISLIKNVEEGHIVQTAEQSDD